MFLSSIVLSSQQIQTLDRTVEDVQHTRRIRYVQLAPWLECHKPKWQELCKEWSTAQSGSTYGCTAVNTALTHLTEYATSCLESDRCMPPARLDWFYRDDTEVSDSATTMRLRDLAREEYRMWCEQLALHLDFVRLVTLLWPLACRSTCVGRPSDPSWYPADQHTCSTCSAATYFRKTSLEAFYRKCVSQWIRRRDRDDIVGAAADGYWNEQVRYAAMALVCTMTYTWNSIIAADSHAAQWLSERILKRHTWEALLYQTHTDEGAAAVAEEEEEEELEFAHWMAAATAAPLLAPLEAYCTEPRTRTVFRFDTSGLYVRDPPTALAMYLVDSPVEQSVRSALEMMLPSAAMTLPWELLPHGTHTHLIRLLAQNHDRVPRVPRLDLYRTVVLAWAIGHTCWSLEVDPNTQYIADELDDGAESFESDGSILSAEYMLEMESWLAHWTHLMVLRERLAIDCSVVIQNVERGMVITKPAFSALDKTYKPDDTAATHPVARLLRQNEARALLPTVDEAIHWAHLFLKRIQANRSEQKNRGACASDPLHHGIGAVMLGYLLHHNDVARFIQRHQEIAQRSYAAVLQYRQPLIYEMALQLAFNLRNMELTALRASALSTRIAESDQLQKLVAEMQVQFQSEIRFTDDMEPIGSTAILRRVYGRMLPVIFAELCRFEEMRGFSRSSALEPSTVAVSQPDAYAEMLREFHRLNLQTEQIIARRPADANASCYDWYDDDGGASKQAQQEDIDNVSAQLAALEDEKRRLIERRFVSTFARAGNHVFGTDLVIVNYAQRCIETEQGIRRERHAKNARCASVPKLYVDAFYRRDDSVPVKQFNHNPALADNTCSDPDMSYIVYVDGEWWIRWGSVLAFTRTMECAVKLRARLAAILGTSNDKTGVVRPEWIDPITREYEAWSGPA